MNKSKISITSILFGIFISSIAIYTSLIFEPIEKKVNNYYQVFIGGEKIGLIKSKDELYDLIDTEQQEIKSKYNVDKVYPPAGLEVQKVMTYNNNVMSAKDVYEEIKDLEHFTIEGYEVAIKSEEGTKKFFILNKEDLDTAIENTVLVFIDKEDYKNYLNNTQKPTEEEGIEITDIYFDQNVSIKKTYVSTDEEIITNADDLSRYFLFGTTNLTNKYSVKASDTIETIAYNNELGVNDFLIANPDIVSENALLAEGQEVIVAPIAPVANIVVDSYQTETQTIKYETKVELDKTMDASKKITKQKGSNGLSKVVYATHEMNGVMLKTKLVSEEVIAEPIDEIVIVGAKNVVYVGNTTYWAWPTTKPYRISSYYGYRVHPIRGEEHFHSGVDITGVKVRDLYAIQEGTVLASSYNSTMGNYLRIEHPNGYVSVYMHLKTRHVKKGDKVVKGQLVGIMGTTGTSTGVHLHLTMYKNGKMINPLSLYK